MRSIITDLANETLPSAGSTRAFNRFRESFRLELEGDVVLCDPFVMASAEMGDDEIELAYLLACPDWDASVETFKAMCRNASGASWARDYVNKCKPAIRNAFSKNPYSPFYDSSGQIQLISLTTFWSDSPVHSGNWSISVNQLKGQQALVTFTGPVECWPISVLPCPIAFIRTNNIIENLGFVLSRMESLKSDGLELQLGLSTPWEYHSEGCSDADQEHLILCWTNGSKYEPLLRELTSIEREEAYASFRSLESFVETVQNVAGRLEDDVEDENGVATFNKFGRITDADSWRRLEKAITQKAEAEYALSAAESDFQKIAEDVIPSRGPDEIGNERSVDSLSNLEIASLQKWLSGELNEGLVDIKYDFARSRYGSPLGSTKIFQITWFPNGQSSNSVRYSSEPGNIPTLNGAIDSFYKLTSVGDLALAATPTPSKDS